MNSPRKIPAPVQELIYNAHFCQPSVLAVAAALPPDDAEIDGWLEEALTRQDPLLFSFLAMAMGAQERPFPARHLVKGLSLVTDEILAEWLTLHAVGDAPEAIVAAASGPPFPYVILTRAMLAAAFICREDRGGVYPPGFRSAVRRLARQKLEDNATVNLITLAVAMDDEVVIGLLGAKRVAALEPAIRAYGDAFLAARSASILEEIPAEAPRVLAHGITMRRSVPRIGRNAPCPCGSTKKYKNCCAGKDQERLHHSTDVAGKTRAELLQDPAEGLTVQRLQRMQPHELGRVNAAQVPERLHREFFMRLGAFQLFDQLLKAFHAIPWESEDARFHAWRVATFFTMQSWQTDAARQLAAAYPESSERLAEFPGYQLLLAGTEPAAFLARAEEVARIVVESEDDSVLENFALGLLYSPWKGIAILVARSMLSILPHREAALIFEKILAARDHLDLSPDDRFSDIIDDRFAEQSTHHHGNQADSLRRAQSKLTAKAHEVRQLKENLAHARRELTLREKPTASAALPETAPTLPSADPQTLRELRAKVRQLKDQLTARHEERAALRRDLRAAEENLGSMPAAPAPVADPEEDLLLPYETDNHQPVRLIEFPHKFQQTLDRFPRSTARAAITMAGRLAAGEPAAYAGVVRLRACHEILRQRIGADYRLLFQLTPSHLRIVDLVNRKNLLARIRQLRARRSA